MTNKGECHLVRAVSLLLIAVAINSLHCVRCLSQLVPIVSCDMVGCIDRVCSVDFDRLKINFI